MYSNQNLCFQEAGRDLERGQPWVGVIKLPSHGDSGLERPSFLGLGYGMGRDRALRVSFPPSSASGGSTAYQPEHTKPSKLLCPKEIIPPTEATLRNNQDLKKSSVRAGFRG